MSDNKLKSIFDRVNRLLDERDALMSDVADIYMEAKKGGLVPKVIRKIVQRSRMDPSKRAEEDALQEMYEAALDAPTRQAMEMALKGATAREIETATGIDHAIVARDMPVRGKAGRKPKLSLQETNKLDVISPPEVAELPAGPMPAHDPETGEIEEETVLHEFAPDTARSTVELSGFSAAARERIEAVAAKAGFEVIGSSPGAGDGDLDIPPRLDRRQRAGA